VRPNNLTVTLARQPHQRAVPDVLLLGIVVARYACASTYNGAKGDENEMFNRSYQIRATRAAVRNPAADAALRLPWAGIFEPWRPLVLVAAAADTLAITKPQIAAKRCNTRGNPLQKLQLDLAFADPAQNGGKSPANSTFPELARMEAPMTDDEYKPLQDLFPEAYHL
jgi:hypothetical protein